MVNQPANGILVTSASEQTLAALSTNAVYVLHLNFETLVTGDMMQIRAKRTCLPTGTVREVLNEVVSYEQVRNNFLFVSIPLSAPYGMTFTLQQLSGSARNVQWGVYRIGEVAVVGSGQKLLTSVESEFSDFSLNQNGCLVLDLTAMIDGDNILITGKADAIQDQIDEQIGYAHIFGGVQAVPIAQFIPLIDSKWWGTEMGVNGSTTIDYSIESFI